MTGQKSLRKFISDLLAKEQKRHEQLLEEHEQFLKEYEKLIQMIEELRREMRKHD